MFKIPEFQEKRHVIKVCDFHVDHADVEIFLKIENSKKYRNDF